MSTVLTYTGKVEKQEDCVFIRGKFYHKERDCYLYNGVYYSPNSRYLVFDHETKNRSHVLESKVTFGIVGLKSNGAPEFGHFSLNLSKNCFTVIPEAILKVHSEEIVKEINDGMAVLSNDLINERGRADRLDYRQSLSEIVDGNPPGRSTRPAEYRPTESIDGASSPGAVAPIFERDKIRCMDFRILPISNYKQVKSTDLIAAKDRIGSAPGMIKKVDVISCAEPYGFNLAYNSELMMDVFASHYDKSDIVPKKYTIAQLGEFIANNPYTFGVEYEAWDGRIPTYICAQTGLIPLRDGSLRHDNVCGFEYASVIMEGAKGFEAIKKQCEALNDFCTFNEKCSTHVHIGSIPRNGDNLINIYTGFLKIQESIFSLFPSCLMDTSTYKQKSYCGPLPDLKLSVDSIVQFLSDGTERFNKFGAPHPKDRTGQSKWNINSRYCFANLCNYYYTGRGTVELRISTPTFNYNKVAALVILCMTIIKSSIEKRHYIDVFTMIDREINSGEMKEWLTTYLTYRVRVLSKFTKAGSSSVIYYETIDNDAETGCKRPLY